jgi:hypothetical protein
VRSFAVLALVGACGGASTRASVELPAPLPPSPQPTVPAPPPIDRIEGSYALDVDATAARWNDRIAALPEDKREGTKMGLSMLRLMHMTVELEAGGVAVTRVTIANLVDPKAPPKSEEERGTWTKERDGVVITSHGKPIHCTKSRSELVCTQADDTLGLPLVFRSP